MSRTFAAASNPLPDRCRAPGMVVAVKKLAVSKTRLAAASSDSVPVIVIGSAAYLLRKVARNAPRIAKGVAVAIGIRSVRAPCSTSSMSTQAGVFSMAEMRSTSSRGAFSTLSTPCSHAASNISTRARKPCSGINAAYASAMRSPVIVALRIVSRSSGRSKTRRTASRVAANRSSLIVAF